MQTSPRPGSFSLLILGFVTLAALATGGCEKGDHHATAAAMSERPPAMVTVADAVVRDVPIYLDEIGWCVSPELVSIIPQVSGRVTAVNFLEGADVKKGELLFNIDPRPYEADLKKAEADFAQDKATLDKAHLDFDRVKELRGTNAISQDEYDQKRLAVDVAKAQLDAAQALIDTAKLNLEYCAIKSPIDGRSGKRLVDVGNVVKANEGSMVVIQRLDPIYAEFTVTDNDLGTVRKFMEKGSLPTTTKLKVEVDLPADSSRVIQALGGVKPTTAPTTKNVNEPRIGDLTFLDNAVETASGTVKVRATLPNGDRYFWPGQFVRCRVILATQKDAVLVPIQARQIGQQGPFIYVAKPDNTAEMRPIAPGQQHGDLLVVEHGLSAGERVIVTGQMSVAPGGKIKVLNPPTTATASAGGQS